MIENTFREKVISDLRKLGIPIISLGTGTFDSYVEEIGLVEFKRLGWNPTYRRAMIEFTKDQTIGIKTLVKKPFVLILGNDKKECYYLMKPEEVLEKLRTRMQWETMWITEDKIPSKRIDSYEEFIKACAEALKK